MASRGRRKKNHGDHDDAQHADERWLLTYADMITLLMALFIVMFAMSSVNETKFDSLQKSLQEAFSGKILGGKAIQETGGSVEAEASTPSVTATTLAPMAKNSPEAQHEQEDFRKLKTQVDARIKQEGLDSRVE